MKSSSKIHLLSYEEDDFQDHLLALHSNLEGYQIAFYLNKHTDAVFKRVEDISLNDKEVRFPLFEWENPLLDENTSLFSNKFIQEKTQDGTNTGALFDLPLRNEVSLFPEFKQVDFFIKSNHLETIQFLIKPMSSWGAVSMAYEVPSEKIKTRLNLIFD